MSSIVNFETFDLVNESLQAAENYLKRKALDEKKRRLGDVEERIGLTPEEQKIAVSDPVFLELKKLTKNGEYVYGFLKFYNEDMPLLGPAAKIRRIQEIISDLDSIDKVKKNRPDLGLPKNFVEYIKPVGGFIELEKDIKSVKNKKLANDWIKNLPKTQRDFFENASEALIGRVARIAKDFSTMGLDRNGNFDPALNKMLQEAYFKRVIKFATLEELLIGADSAIESSKNISLSKFLNSCNEVNSKYGTRDGVDIVLQLGDILIVEVKSFEANRSLNSNVRHCIVDNRSSWNDYVSLGKKQIYFYNFGLDPKHPLSILGITLNRDGSISDCFNRENKRVMRDEVLEHLSGFGIDKDFRSTKIDPFVSQFHQSKRKMILNANPEQRRTLEVIKQRISLLEKSIQQYFYLKSMYFESCENIIECGRFFVISQKYTDMKILLDRCDKSKTGELDIVHNQSNILILRIDKFETNRELNSHSAFKNTVSKTYWNQESANFRQFYVYNFNLPSRDPRSLVSITLGRDNMKVYGCRLKDGSEFAMHLSEMLKLLNVPHTVFMLGKDVAPKTSRPTAPLPSSTKVSFSEYQAIKGVKPDRKVDMTSSDELLNLIVTNRVLYRDIFKNERDPSFSPDKSLSLTVQKMSQGSNIPTYPDPRERYYFCTSTDLKGDTYFLLFEDVRLKIVLNLGEFGFSYFVFNEMIVFHIPEASTYVGILASSGRTFKWGEKSEVTVSGYHFKKIPTLSKLLRFSSANFECRYNFIDCIYKQTYNLPSQGTLSRGSGKFLTPISSDRIPI